MCCKIKLSASGISWRYCASCAQSLPWSNGTPRIRIEILAPYQVVASKTRSNVILPEWRCFLHWSSPPCSCSFTDIRKQANIGQVLSHSNGMSVGIIPCTLVWMPPGHPSASGVHRNSIAPCPAAFRIQSTRTRRMNWKRVRAIVFPQKKKACCIFLRWESCLRSFSPTLGSCYSRSGPCGTQTSWPSFLPWKTNGDNCAVGSRCECALTLRLDYEQSSSSFSELNDSAKIKINLVSSWELKRIQEMMMIVRKTIKIKFELLPFVVARVHP